MSFANTESELVAELFCLFFVPSLYWSLSFAKPVLLSCGLLFSGIFLPSSSPTVEETTIDTENTSLLTRTSLNAIVSVVPLEVEEDSNLHDRERTEAFEKALSLQSAEKTLM